MENLAIVDLGSNSVRMAITEIADNGDFWEIKRVKENTRLSEEWEQRRSSNRKQLNTRLRP